MTWGDMRDVETRRGQYSETGGKMQVGTQEALAGIQLRRQVLVKGQQTAGYQIL